MKYLLFLIGLVFLMASCSDVEIQRVTDKKNQKGIRFYRPHPYLLVTREKVQQPSDQKEKRKKDVKPKESSNPDTAADDVITNIQIVWLPDKKEEYTIVNESWFGTVDYSIKLDNGWQLTQFGAKIDSKVPETVTAALGKLIETPSEEEKGEIEPGLYRLKFDDNGWVIAAVLVPFKPEESPTQEIPTNSQTTP